MTTSKQVAPLYQKVVEDVITNVKEAFLDEGVDEQILLELRHLWEKKLTASKALDHGPELDVSLGDRATGRTLKDQGTNAQKLRREQVRQAAVLAVGPQPLQQTLPATVTANPPELVGAPTQTTMTIPLGQLGLFQQQLAAFGAAQQGGITLQATADGQLIAIQNIGGQPTAIAIPQQVLVSQEPVQVQTHGVAGVGQVTATPTADQQSQNSSTLRQLDGTGDGSSSSEDEDFDQDNDDNNEDEQNDDEPEQGEEEVPLNSDDDVSEEDSTEVFDTENVVVCQFDKINRNKNKWKFNLKDGIMSLNGKDFVFQRALGDAEW